MPILTIRVVVYGFAQMKNFKLTSLGKGGTNVPPDFRNSSKKLFHIDSELLRSRDSKSSELRYLGYFWKISNTNFFF